MTYRKPRIEWLLLCILLICSNACTVARQVYGRSGLTRIAAAQAYEAMILAAALEETQGVNS